MEIERHTFRMPVKCFNQLNYCGPMCDANQIRMRFEVPYKIFNEHCSYNWWPLAMRIERKLSSFQLRMWNFKSLSNTFDLTIWFHTSQNITNSMDIFWSLTRWVPSPEPTEERNKVMCFFFQATFYSFPASKLWTNSIQWSNSFYIAKTCVRCDDLSFRWKLFPIKSIRKLSH